uniref:ATP synthase subunit a n=1 Tax=Whitmania acranulata TaxID=1329092 RepID=X2CBU0_WHICA|nr:ATP synthase F0 subunit 6 [Whitmania acranulata]AGL34620.1 ATP synthase F0 subunit 6 [Whitmania acranulata]QIC20353.1 ATPase subunits 6 [Whitmania acranulata]
MCLDVFSNFDLYEFNYMLYNKELFNMCMFLINNAVYSFMSVKVWNLGLNISFMFSVLMSIMKDQCNRTHSYFLNTSQLFVVALFLTLVSVNLTGLISFSFSTSSHLLFTLIIGLPLWMSMIMSSFVFKSKSFIAHLLPDGAPLWLNPLLVLIESVSIMVRPVTLSFRLAANMTAGHVVLCLMTSYLCIFMNCFNIQHLVLLTMSMVYVLFEVGICMIQGYIFQLLFFFLLSGLISDFSTLQT